MVSRPEEFHLELSGVRESTGAGSGFKPLPVNGLAQALSNCHMRRSREMTQFART